MNNCGSNIVCNDFLLLRLYTLINIAPGRTNLPVQTGNYIGIYSGIVDHYSTVRNQVNAARMATRTYVWESEDPFGIAFPRVWIHDKHCLFSSCSDSATHSRGGRRTHDKLCVALIITCRLARMTAIRRSRGGEAQERKIEKEQATKHYPRQGSLPWWRPRMCVMTNGRSQWPMIRIRLSQRSLSRSKDIFVITRNRLHDGG